MGKRKKIYKDHLGNTYNTQKEMCDEYNVPAALFCKRLSRGWSLERALTTAVDKTTYHDHLGNEYVTQKEMCSKYNIRLNVFLVRINRGWSLKDALTKEVRKRG